MDFDTALYHCTRLAVAFVLSLPVAWDRERAERTLGLRTFPLVAMASTGYLLMARTISGGDAGAEARFFHALSQAGQGEGRQGRGRARLARRRLTPQGSAGVLGRTR